MSLPVLDKAYDFTKVNQTIAASGTLDTDCKKVLFAIVNSMVTFGAFPWLCVGSSNGIGTGALDAVNRWAAFGNLIWANAGTNHSWIVLKSQVIGLAGGIQVCFDLNQVATPYRINIIFSATAGFTGGSPTARPTATDEQVLFGAGQAWIPSVSENNVVHVWQSTDGEVLNACVFALNVPQFAIHVSKPKNPITGWTKPSIYWAVGVGIGSVYQTSLHYNTAAARAWLANDTSVYLSGEAVNNVLIESYQGFPDDQSGEWPFGPIGLYSQTSGSRGRKGQLFDLWWGSTVAGNGDNYPADSSKQFVQFGHLIFPWNGSTPLTA